MKCAQTRSAVSSDFRHDADAADSHAARLIENVRDVLKIEVRRTGDEERAIGPADEDFLETLREILPCDRLSVDVDGAVGMNADYDIARRRWRAAAFAGRRRSSCVEAFGVMRNDA